MPGAVEMALGAVSDALVMRSSKMMKPVASGWNDSGATEDASSQNRSPDVLTRMAPRWNSFEDGDVWVISSDFTNGRRAAGGSRCTSSASSLHSQAQVGSRLTRP